MKIGVAGSVGLDHLMTFSGKFTDSFVSGSLEKVSLSFLVDSLDVRRGGCAANICYGMGVLGLNPVLIAAVGKDWADYEAWLSRHGVDTSHALVSTTLYTAHFMVTTDDDLNQIASFFPGAMSEARNIELGPIMEKTGRFDMVVISPDDPQAMLHHSDVCRKEGIPFAADPSQQMARMSGEEIKLLIDGASYLFLNEYELALAMQKTGWSEGLSHERCAQLGSLIATYVIETMGTQEYRFTSTEFLDRFEGAYGAEAASQIAPHLSF
ncbi:MAG: carbohydrate kinase family protein [Actinobacteria bacterium]|nr:carbohydrate kinase family protein [Actinomycetota bacterium]